MILLQPLLIREEEDYLDLRDLKEPKVVMAPLETMAQSGREADQVPMADQECQETLDLMVVPEHLVTRVRMVFLDSWDTL